MSIFKDKSTKEELFSRIITQDYWPPRASDYLDMRATPGQPLTTIDDSDRVPFAASAAGDLRPDPYFSDRNRMNVRHPGRPRYGRAY
jgi:hypothetical protein